VQEQLIKNLKEAIDFLENSLYCSTMLLNLINDLMDLAKLEKMKFELNNEFFDLTKTIKNAISTLGYFSKQKSIQPEFLIEKDFEPFFHNIHGDEGRFNQILLNFLSNAFKFTPLNGKISIKIQPIPDQQFA